MVCCNSTKPKTLFLIIDGKTEPMNKAESRTWNWNRKQQNKSKRFLHLVNNALLLFIHKLNQVVQHSLFGMLNFVIDHHDSLRSFIRIILSIHSVVIFKRMFQQTNTVIEAETKIASMLDPFTIGSRTEPNWEYLHCIEQHRPTLDYPFNLIHWEHGMVSGIL